MSEKGSVCVCVVCVRANCVCGFQLLLMDEVKLLSTTCMKLSKCDIDREIDSFCNQFWQHQLRLVLLLHKKIKWNSCNLYVFLLWGADRQFLFVQQEYHQHASQILEIKRDLSECVCVCVSGCMCVCVKRERNKLKNEQKKKKKEHDMRTIKLEK